MKNFKLLAAILLLAVSVTIYSCDPDEETPAGADFSVEEVELAPVGMSSDAEINGKLKVKNTSSEQINLYWVRNDVSLPNGWESTVCDHELCYPVSTTERDLVLEAGQEIELKLTFYANGTRGSGSTDLVLYDKADQAGTTNTHTFTATAN